MEILTWADGEHSLIDIADKCNCPVWELYSLVEELINHNLVNKIDILKTTSI